MNTLTQLKFISIQQILYFLFFQANTLKINISHKIIQKELLRQYIR